MSMYLRFGCLFFLLVSTLLAAPTAPEKELFVNGRRAFQEGIFDLADQRLDQLLKKFPTTDYKAEARLIQAQALYYLGQYEKTTELLKSPLKQVPENFRADYVFWQAEAYAALNRWEAAEDKYRELIAQFPKEEQIQAAQLGLAWSLLQQKRDEEAKQRLQSLTVNQPKKVVGQRAALILGKYALTQNDLKEAATRLEALLTQKPEGDIFFEAQYWLAETLYQDKKPKEALAHYEAITSQPRAYPKALVAQAWFGAGRADQALKQHEAALVAFEKAYTLGDAEALKLSAFKLYLLSGRELQRLPDAVKTLQEFAQKNQNQPNNAAALLAIGLAWSEAGDANQAINTLEALLIAYPQSRWRAPTLLELGKLYLVAQKPAEAAKSFQRAIDSSDQTTLTQQANFQLGQALIAQKDYLGAIQVFQKVTAPVALAEQASFNVLSLYAQTQNLDAFTKAEDIFRKQFSQSELLPQITLLQGRLLEKSGKKEEAKQLYQKAITTLTDSAERPRLLVRLADMFYQNQQVDEALQLYDQFINDYKTHELLPEVAHKHILVSLVAKKITREQALQMMEALLKRFPSHPQAPEILFSLGELYFNKQDFVNAHAAFERVSKDYPAQARGDDSLYWAAKASVGHLDFDSAIALLDRIPENSGWKAQARLLQGKIYQQQKLRFADAIPFFDAVLTTEKAGDRYADALLRKGECLFALGSKDPGSYDLAASTFGLLLTSNQGTLAQRNEAGYKRAKCFEKLNRPPDALDLYLQVLGGQLAPSESATATQPPEFRWQILAGQEAAQLYENRQDWKGALAIYQRLIQIGGPTQQEFKDRVNRIRRDNFIYDNG
jgi:TolA-binding protein